MEKKTILRQDEFAIRAPLKLKIGDPMYLRDIEKGTTTGREKDYVFDEKPYSSGLKETLLTITEQAEMIEVLPGEKMEVRNIIVNIIGVSTRYSKENRDAIKETLKNGAYHEDLLEKEGALGCDTAEFLLQTEKSRSILATGGDGEYGYYLKYIQDIAYLVELAFSTDLYNFDTVTDIMKTTFNFL